MKRRFGPSLYFANDKVIFDALNQRQVSTDLIRELLKERNIVVSSSTPKEDLARYFSRLTADFFDHKSIAMKLGRISRQERVTSFEVKDELSQTQIIDALNAIKQDLENQGDTADIEVADGKIVAVVGYEDVDYTKSEFRQVQPRDAVIEFAKDETGKYVVRSTQNQFTSAAVEKICKHLGESIGKEIDRMSISLQGHAEPAVRTKFFENLIKSVPEHKFVTVTEAYCFKPKVKAAIDDSGDEEEKELEDQPFVERVRLTGHGVDRSFVIDDLYKNGYYIVKVVWHIRPASQIDSDIFEVEAQFSDPESCTGFSYLSRSVIIVDEGKITEKRRSPKRDEQARLFELLEKAAKLAYHSI
ncbi:hypothetical protein VI03_30065 [Burkholderia vietnamiensis]|uniref:hypothetical protein n=1 Tax=Burkholderia vietnamiensis TaxID=60552 RepID=UPI00062272E7|nr:hypothetical protein [Burkholderia vietnamiensis]KKI35144.1 hypothetical protein VI03_30065 [Burkholderia vietnamiensis]